MRFLFTTIQGFESDFYGRVGAELSQRGHDVFHVTYSRRAARLLRESGVAAFSVRERLANTAPEVEQTRRIQEQYALATIRDVYRTDPPCDGKPERWCVERTIRHFLALEELFDEIEPDVLVPEVGSEMLRTVAHLVALDRGIPTLFLFYTIFPRPLRLYVDTMHAPIVPPDELRELAAEERAEVETFRREFIARREPIRPHRRPGVTARRLRRLGMYVRARLGEDRDNEYLRPGAWLLGHAAESPRRLAARAFYSGPPTGKPFVYFPLHVTDDYKIKRVIPQWVDQAAVVDGLADALPPGCELVIKEHPMSIGRNGLAFLRRLARRANVRLVSPQTNSHELIRGAEAVAVISSTVGLEALLYEKPVLTLGRPFYSGYGITLDIDTLAEVRDAVPALLRFRADTAQIERFLHAAMSRCYDGAPVLVDDSDENARALAASLERAAAPLQAARETAHAPRLRQFG